MKYKARVRSGMGYAAGSCPAFWGVVWGRISGADFGCVNARVVWLWWGRWAGLGGVRFIRYDYAGGGGKSGLGEGGGWVLVVG